MLLQSADIADGFEEVLLDKFGLAVMVQMAININWIVFRVRNLRLRLNRFDELSLCWSEGHWGFVSSTQQYRAMLSRIARLSTLKAAATFVVGPDLL